LCPPPEARRTEGLPDLQGVVFDRLKFPSPHLRWRNLARCFLAFAAHCTLMGVDLLLSFAHLALRMAFSRAPPHWSTSQTSPGLDQLSPCTHPAELPFLARNSKSMSAQFIIHWPTPGRDSRKKRSCTHSCPETDLHFLRTSLHCLEGEH
jgi:hypothetical protein